MKTNRVSAVAITEDSAHDTGPAKYSYYRQHWTISGMDKHTGMYATRCAIRILVFSSHVSQRG